MLLSHTTKDVSQNKGPKFMDFRYFYKALHMPLSNNGITLRDGGLDSHEKTESMKD